MPGKAKKVTFEQLDQGIKAAYTLGCIDGKNTIRPQLQDLRNQLTRMLTTNRELHSELARQDIYITRCNARKAYTALRRCKEYHAAKVIATRYRQIYGVDIAERKRQ